VNRFVATLSARRISSKARSWGEQVRIGTGDLLDVTLSGHAGAVTLAIRPEQVSLLPEGTGIPAKISEMTYMGTDTHYTFALSDGSHMVARVQSNMAVAYHVGDTVGVKIGTSAVQVLKS